MVIFVLLGKLHLPVASVLINIFSICIMLMCFETFVVGYLDSLFFHNNEKHLFVNIIDSEVKNIV